LLTLGADLPLEMPHQVGDDAVVVEQGIVNVEEENQLFVSHRDAALPSAAADYRTRVGTTQIRELGRGGGDLRHLPESAYFLES
jgi:hypothetical protein